MKLAFVDLETTGLNPDYSSIWEIAIIIRVPSGREYEHHWQIRQTEIHLRDADPKALEIGRYYERMVVSKEMAYAQITPDGHPVGVSRRALMDNVAGLLTDAVMIGSNPAFDAAFLRVFLDSSPWHYRTIDIATLAAGFRFGQAKSGAYGGDFTFATDYPQLPYKSYDLSRAVDVEPPTADVAHTALGDARWAMAVYDAVTGGGA